MSISLLQINESVGRFLTALAGGLVNVAWSPRTAEAANLEWWSCTLTVDEACRFYAGAAAHTWGELSFESFLDAVERAAAGRFGSQVRCTGAERCEAPAIDGTAVVFEAGSAGSIEFVLSPELSEALGGEQAVQAKTPVQRNSVDMLMHVEIPVSVSLGRTKLKMRELLNLTQGSIVQLDQDLGDEVEIRVNNSVIARGEVVAVDGNYGVRIIEMVGNGQVAGARGLA